MSITSNFNTFPSQHCVLVSICYGKCLKSSLFESCHPMRVTPGVVAAPLWLHILPWRPEINIWSCVQKSGVHQGQIKAIRTKNYISLEPTDFRFPAQGLWWFLLQWHYTSWRRTLYLWRIWDLGVIWLFSKTTSVGEVRVTMWKRRAANVQYNDT